MVFAPALSKNRRVEKQSEIVIPQDGVMQKSSFLQLWHLKVQNSCTMFLRVQDAADGVTKLTLLSS